MTVANQVLAQDASGPVARSEAEARRRFSNFLLIAAYASFIGTACQVMIDSPAALVYSDLAIALVLLFLRYWALRVPGTGRLTFTTHFMAGGSLIFITWHGMITGQNASLGLWFTAAIPILAAFLGGPRVAVLWTVLSCVALLGIWASEFVWRIESVMPPTSDTTLQARLILTVLAAAFGIAARMASDRQIAALAQSLAAEQEAKRIAEEASRAKSVFLATMSHEIRTPLNSIIGFNSLLLDLPLGERERHYLELARRSGESLLHLVNDFLDFSKMEAGQLKLEQLVFDPGREVRDVLAQVRERAHEKGLVLHEVIEVPAVLRGDAVRLRQILLNLLSNAVKFTERGDVTLRCQPLQRPGEAQWLRFEVEDTGIGISMATQARLFQPFTQADASTTRQYGGTGLGLAICRSLTELMGGRVGVDSREGNGSVFWLELPFEPVRPGSGEPAADDALPAPRLTQARVLVAEDNPVSQITVSEMLRRLGCEVEVVDNGEAAVEALRQRDFDLVLMDCNMPVMDGFDACGHIRALPRTQVPVIALTANALLGDREKCLAAGMDDYLSKPLRLVELRRVLAQWLGHDSAAKS